MKLFNGVILLLLLSSVVSLAQPRWSAKLRAKSEIDWMKEDLRLSGEQLTRASVIVQDFHQQMDKAGETPETRDKAQQRLMRKKDMDMKALLNKAQYQKYYANQIQMRQRERATYKDGRQPL